MGEFRSAMLTAARDTPAAAATSSIVTDMTAPSHLDNRGEALHQRSQTLAPRSAPPVGCLARGKSMKTTGSRRSLRVLAAVVATSAVLAGCSSQGGAQDQPAASTGGGGSGTGQSFTIAMITHEAPGDTFWDKVRAGAEQAAKNTGVELKYSNDPDGTRQATLVQNAIDSKVDGIAVTLTQVDAVGPVAQKAVEAGIPVVAFNGGITDYQKFGISTYFGSDEDVAGQAVGQRLSQEGGTGKSLCVITEQGSVALEARCAGVKKTYPDTENLYVNGTDLPSVQATIGAKLQQDPSISTIVALGAPFAMAAVQAKTGAGSQAKVVSFDLNSDLVNAMKEKQVEFTVDQQPYVQGYMAVEALWLNLVNGNDLGGGKPVLTGPSFVDNTNIDKIAGFAASNTR
ncbi:MAG TPA: substrate-binding domain-containing protein [Pseudonocardia sp.]|nr:substrate-binding domain-containing protein [Pseudonocardia sp.]